MTSKKQCESSAGNVYRSLILDVLDRNSTANLKVDVDKAFVAQITKRSFTDMGFNTGSEVFLTFKASSLILA